MLRTLQPRITPPLLLTPRQHPAYCPALVVRMIPLRARTFLDGYTIFPAAVRLSPRS